MGNKGGALVHRAGATELVFRDDVDIGASRRRNASCTFQVSVGYDVALQ